MDKETILRRVDHTLLAPTATWRGSGADEKVIVEACLLSEYEKIKLCEIVTAAGADRLGTSSIEKIFKGC